MTILGKRPVGYRGRPRLCGRTASAGAALCLFLGLGSCGRAPDVPKPRNFILITLDTQRADHIGAYGSTSARTPAIDAFARGGVLYENAYSLIPITLPSHASIFFSVPPHSVRSYTNGTAVGRRPAHPPLAELFRRAGFDTAAFVSLGVLGSEYKLDEGFQNYVDDFPPGRWYLSAREVNDRVFPWLEAHKDRNFFLWIHYSDPHEPYAPPDVPDDTKVYLNGKEMGSFCLDRSEIETLDLDLKKGRNELLFVVADPSPGDPGRYAARLERFAIEPAGGSAGVAASYSPEWLVREQDGVSFLKSRASVFLTCPSGPASVKLTFRGKRLLTDKAFRDGYRREVEYMDAEIGRLRETLKRLALEGQTAVMLAGDHGEGLGEYRTVLGGPHFGHIHFLYDVYLKIPLILYVPSADLKGIRRAETTTLLDVAPTIAAVMGLKNSPEFRGRDLTRLKEGAETTVFQETFKPEAVKERFAVLERPRHLIFCPEEDRYELFDLDKNPGEREPVPGEDGSSLPSGAFGLKAKLDAYSRDVLKNKSEVKVEEKSEEMLKALGYLGGKE
jgi:membrane-anchored protein YejM (alkaline phosphatase superfamily)